MSNTSTNKTANKPTKSNKDKDKLRVIVGEIGRDTKTGILGRGYSYDNGKTFRVTDTMYGRLYGTDDIDAIWSNGTSDRVKREVDSATAEIPAAVSAANSAVSAAESAVAASKVNSDAIVAQSEAISEAKSAMDSATAEIQQTAANAASDAAKIRADVAQVQSEVDTAKAANSASVEALKSDVSAVKQDIQAAQQANENVTKQLDTYTEQAQAQGKTIKDIQDAQDGYTATIADIKGNVSKISDTVDGLSASLKDDQTDVATLKAQADQLSATLTDHDKSIAQLTASARELSSTLEDADGRLSKVEQTASTLTNEFSDQQGHLNRVEQTAQGTEQTVANQQGQINTIKTDASGIHETLTGQGNQIASINVTLNGLSSKYEGVSGDLGKLSDKVTTNSTQITQNKKEIDLKADQSTVNNLTGEVSQNKAQLKVQAGQISSKVSSTDFKTLNDKVNGMQIGGRNLLLGTSTDEKSGKAYAFAGYQIAGGLKPNTTYTFSGWARVDQKAMDNQQHVFVCAYTNDWSWDGWLNIDGSLTAKYNKVTFTTPTGNNFAPYVTVYLQHPNNDPSKDSISGQGFISKLKLEEGNVATAWTPAPEDAITAIQKNATAIDQTDQKISLKADQTEVDKVKNTATQNSSRLNVMAGEISSKVTSTDVNNIVDKKGYATTSTVQSLITQKAGTINESITNLDAKYSAKDGVNLQRGTGDCSFPISSYNATVTIENYDDHTKMFHVKGTNGFYTSYNAGTSFVPTVGETYTVSADVKGGGTTSGDSFKYEGADSCSLGTVTLTDTWQRISNTVHIGSVRGQWIFYLNNNAGDFYVKHIKIERGPVATPWTPAPSDNATVTQVQSLTASIDGIQSTVANKADKSQITQLSNVIQSKVSSSDFNNLRKAVDLQTLDSADINSMKTNGHYFVRNLANNPVGGWVYVDVTGNGNDRIRQDVYQDNGNEHKYRRWVNDHWTNWDEGANYSEITQLRDDINLRVKSGDLLSQINIQAGRTLIQSQKIYMDANSVIMGPNTKAFIPAAAIINLDADKINTGILNGIEIRQANTNGRTIDIKNGNISISSNDVVEPRLSFINKGAITKAFNAIGDLETLDQHFMLFNFKPSDTQSMHPISYFTVNNTGDKGSGNAQIQFDHAVINGHEWWANSDGITFGRSWDGVHGSSDYVNLYAKSFAQNSELSAKTRIEKLDKKKALDKIMQDDMYTYQYKSDVRDGVPKRYASFIIDNVNNVAQYREPAEFLSANRHGRDDGTQLAYLIAAFQYQHDVIEEMQKEIEELKNGTTEK